MFFFFFFFFFQAEDGIRDHCVTGVQTCALRIWQRGPRRLRAGRGSEPSRVVRLRVEVRRRPGGRPPTGPPRPNLGVPPQGARAGRLPRRGLRGPRPRGLPSADGRDLHQRDEHPARVHHHEHVSQAGAACRPGASAADRATHRSGPGRRARGADAIERRRRDGAEVSKRAGPSSARGASRRAGAIPATADGAAPRRPGAQVHARPRRRSRPRRKARAPLLGTGRLFALVLAAGLVGALLWLVNGPLLRVGSVAWAGARYTTDDQVAAILEPLKGSSLLTLDDAAVAGRLASLPGVRAAHVGPTL